MHLASYSQNSNYRIVCPLYLIWIHSTDLLPDPGDAAGALHEHLYDVSYRQVNGDDLINSSTIRGRTFLEHIFVAGLPLVGKCV